MIQIQEQTYQQQFDMYMGVEKEELVKMLIECNKHLDRLTKCDYYIADPRDTGMRCLNCGKNHK